MGKGEGMRPLEPPVPPRPRPVHAQLLELQVAVQLAADQLGHAAEPTATTRAAEPSACAEARSVGSSPSVSSTVAR